MEVFQKGSYRGFALEVHRDYMGVTAVAVDAQGQTVARVRKGRETEDVTVIRLKMAVDRRCGD